MNKFKVITRLLVTMVMVLTFCVMASAETIELRWVFGGTSDIEMNYAQSLTEAFNKSHKDVHLTVEFIPWADIMTKLVVMARAGTPPDMAWLPPIFASDLQSMGFLTDIDEYVGNWDELEHFYDELLEQITYDGKLYTIPTMCEVVATGGHFRKDTLEALYGSANSIKTWDDWLVAFEAVHNKDMDGDGKVDTYALGVDPWDVINMFESLARNNGPMYLRDILDEDKKEQWFEVFDFLKKLSKYNLPGIESMDYKDLQRSFTEGLVVFLPYTGSWMFGNIYEINPDVVNEENIGIMAGPVGPSHEGEALVGLQAYGPYVFKDIPESHIAASAEFIKFQGNKENGARFPGFMHAPARDDISVDDVMKYSPYTEEAYAWYLNIWLELLDKGVAREKIPNANYLRDVMTNIYLDLMSDNITVEEAYDIWYKETSKESWEK